MSDTLGSVNVDSSKLSDRDKQELQQFMQSELQKSTIQESIHSLTDICFKKCVPSGKISSGKLDSYEEPCLQNCVNRFIDAQSLVMKQLESMKQ